MEEKKLNIIFFSLVLINDINEIGIYQDLLREFYIRNHNLTIVSPLERRFNKNTKLEVAQNISYLKVKSFNLQKTSLIEKLIGSFTLQYLYKKKLKKYFKNTKFDLIIYATPPINLTKVIKWLKLRDKATTYLLLKDIFPQNAIDLNLFKQKSIIHSYFRKIELELYEISDKIGCMSPANLKYFCNKNSSYKHKAEINPNCIDLSKKHIFKNKNEIFRKYKIPDDKSIYIYAGNIGKPQGIEFLLSIIEISSNKFPDIFFVIVGGGTEFKYVKKWSESNEYKNYSIIKQLPKIEVDELASYCNVGIILLRQEFTIPNFPSRLLTYLNNSLPVICITDIVSDVGKIAEENDFGKWSKYGDEKSVLNNIYYFENSLRRKSIMGQKGYNFMKNNYNSENSYNIIINAYKLINNG